MTGRKKNQKKIRTLFFENVWKGIQKVLEEDLNFFLMFSEDIVKYFKHFFCMSRMLFRRPHILFL